MSVLMVNNREHIQSLTLIFITDELVLRLENSLPYLSDPRLLQSRLLDFVVESVCPSTTYNVSLTVDRIREYKLVY